MTFTSTPLILAPRLSPATLSKGKPNNKYWPSKSMRNSNVPYCTQITAKCVSWTKTCVKPKTWASKPLSGRECVVCLELWERLVDDVRDLLGHHRAELRCGHRQVLLLAVFPQPLRLGFEAGLLALRHDERAHVNATGLQVLEQGACEVCRPRAITQQLHADRRML